MSYLRGPLTRDQIATLEADRAPAATPPSPAPASAPPPGAALEAAGGTAATATVTAPNDSTRVAPEVAPGVAVSYAVAAAPWLGEVGSRPGSRLEAAVIARVHLRFDDARAGLDESTEWEAVFFPLTASIDPASAHHVDYDARDLRPEAPPGANYVLPLAPLGQRTFFADIERDLRDYLVREQRRSLPLNRKLKLFGRVRESAEDFARRCDEAAQAAADQEAAKLRDRFDAKIESVRDAIARAEDRVEVLKTDTSTRRTSEVISIAGDILGSFLGGKRSTRSMATGAGRILRGASSRRGVSQRTSQRLGTAEEQLVGRQEDLEELEAELLAELEEINDRWKATGREIETVEIGLERGDVTVQELALAWLPVGS